MARAATALCGGASLAWDAGLREQHQAHMERMEGEGRRVMAAATRDLDPATFDPGGDLDRLRALGLDARPDRAPGQGPLAGIVTALREHREQGVDPFQRPLRPTSAQEQVLPDRHLREEAPRLGDVRDKLRELLVRQRLLGPVVLVENELVWVPGICRSVAAPHRPEAAAVEGRQAKRVEREEARKAQQAEYAANNN